MCHLKGELRMPHPDSEEICGFCVHYETDGCKKDGTYRCDVDNIYRYPTDAVAEDCQRFSYVRWADIAERKSLVDHCPQQKRIKYTTAPSTCYISTAVVSILNLSDSCTEELNVLRKFRFEVLSKNLVYKDLLLNYDFYGPKIVNGLYACQANRRCEIAIDVFQVIRRCVTAIKAGDYQAAVQEYKEMTEALIEEFCAGVSIPDEIRENYDQSIGGHGHLKFQKA